MAPKFKKNPLDFLDDALRQPTPNAGKFKSNATRLADIERESAELTARQTALGEASRRHQAQNRMIDPATTAEAKSIQNKLKSLEDERTSLQKENTALEPYSSTRELKPGVKTAGTVAAVAGTVAGGGALLAGALQRPEDKQDKNPPGTPSLPTAPPPQSPAGGGFGTPGLDANFSAERSRQDATDLTKDIVRHNQSLTDPDYLNRVNQDNVKNALLLGGPGAAATSAQTSEAILANQALGFDNNATDRFSKLVEWETRERGDIRNQQTQMLGYAKDLASDIIRSKNAMHGQIMGSFAQGLSGLYQQAQQVAPVRTEFNPGLSTGGIPAISRNTNLIKGFN